MYHCRICGKMPAPLLLFPDYPNTDLIHGNHQATPLRNATFIEINDLIRKGFQHKKIYPAKSSSMSAEGQKNSVPVLAVLKSNILS